MIQKVVFTPRDRSGQGAADQPALVTASTRSSRCRPDRLPSQVGRILELNGMGTVTREVLVIGAA